MGIPTPTQTWRLQTNINANTHTEREPSLFIRPSLQPIHPIQRTTIQASRQTRTTPSIHRRADAKREHFTHLRTRRTHVRMCVVCVCERSRPDAQITKQIRTSTYVQPKHIHTNTGPHTMLSSSLAMGGGEGVCDHSHKTARNPTPRNTQTEMKNSHSRVLRFLRRRSIRKHIYKGERKSTKLLRDDGMSRYRLARSSAAQSPKNPTNGRVLRDCLAHTPPAHNRQHSLSIRILSIVASPARKQGASVACVCVFVWLFCVHRRVAPLVLLYNTLKNTRLVAYSTQAHTQRAGVSAHRVVICRPPAVWFRRATERCLETFLTCVLR